MGGGIDTVVNCLEYRVTKPFARISSAAFDKSLEHCLTTAVTMISACLPYLQCSASAHVLSVSPEGRIEPEWLKSQGVHYATCKTAISMFATMIADMHEEITVNTLWSSHVNTTSLPTANVLGQPHQVLSAAATADAAVLVLSHNLPSGIHLLDTDVLQANGITDLTMYSVGQQHHKPLEDGPMASESAGDGSFGPVFVVPPAVHWKDYRALVVGSQCVRDMLLPLGAEVQLLSKEASPESVKQAPNALIVDVCCDGLLSWNTLSSAALRRLCTATVQKVFLWIKQCTVQWKSVESIVFICNTAVANTPHALVNMMLKSYVVGLEREVCGARVNLAFSDVLDLIPGVLQSELHGNVLGQE